jgi:hypothetical protein
MQLSGCANGYANASTSGTGCPVDLRLSVLTPLSGAGRAKLAGELTSFSFTLHGQPFEGWPQKQCFNSESGTYYSCDDHSTAVADSVNYSVFLNVNGTPRGDCTAQGEVGYHYEKGVAIDVQTCSIAGPIALAPGDLVQLRIVGNTNIFAYGGATWGADFGPPTPTPPPAPDPWD